jgi:hypothetical protein
MAGIFPAQILTSLLSLLPQIPSRLSPEPMAIVSHPGKPLHCQPAIF